MIEPKGADDDTEPGLARSGYLSRSRADRLDESTRNLTPEDGADIAGRAALAVALMFMAAIVVMLAVVGLVARNGVCP